MQLAYAQQLLAGSLPNRDFVDPGMPLTYVLSAAVQALSPGPYGELLLTSALLAAAAVLTCIVAWKLTGSFAAGIAAAFFTIVLKPQFYNYAKVLTPAVTLWLVQRYTDRTTPHRLIALGVWTIVAGLFRYDLGLYAAVGVLVALAARHWGNRSGMVEALFGYTAAFFVSVMPYVVYLLFTGGVGAQLRDSVEFARADEHQLAVAWPESPVVSGLAPLTEWTYLDAAAFLFVFVYAAIAACAGLAFLRRQPDVPSRLPTVLAAAAILAMYAGVILRHPLATRLLDLASIGSIAATFIVAEGAHWTRALWQRRGAYAYAGLAAGAATLVVSTALAFNVWTLARVGENLRETRVADGLSKVVERAGVVRARASEWPWSAWWPNGRFPENVMSYLDRCTAPADRLYVTWPAAEYYFFSRRPFAGGHSWMLPPRAFTGEQFQAQTIARLRRAHVPVVLINESRRDEFRQAYPQIDAFLTRNYRPVGSYMIYDGSEISVATRIDLGATSTFGADAWPCGFSTESRPSAAHPAHW